MMGSIFAGTDESPGKKFRIKGKFYKRYRGMGSIGAMSAGSANRYFQKSFKDKSKFVPEGVEGRVEYKGKVSKIIYQLQGGLRSSMGYIGAKKLEEINKKAKFVKITKAGFYESMVHSVEMTQKTINLQIMIKIFINYNFIIIFQSIFAKSDNYEKGIELYNKDKLEEAKFKFQQDIVFNPKSELSYLYLSKIYNKQDKNLEEQNLNTVMLLNPKNEEAIYYLAKLKLKNSDYKKKELNSKLNSICKNFCVKSKELKIEIENLSKKNKCEKNFKRKRKDNNY